MQALDLSQWLFSAALQRAALECHRRQTPDHTP